MNNQTQKRFKNLEEYIYWIYANLNMCMATLRMHKTHYSQKCYMIRAKAFKAYKDGNWKIHSLYENNNLKMDWGKNNCWYCGKSTDECGELTIEHIFPKARGGDDSFDNIAYACQKCNSSKNDKDLIVWMSNSLRIVPPLFITCIYMKLVYKFSKEHNLMNLHSEDLEQLNLPFNHCSLMYIENFINNYYLEIYKDYE